MIEVAKIGKTVGVHGGVKLHIMTDFPQIFSRNISFLARKGSFKQEIFEIKIKHFKKGIAYFEGYESLESAKELVNVILGMSLEDTKKICKLREGEMFWFEVVGCEIIEGEECLGIVKEVERIGNIDYLIVDAKTSCLKLPKSFMIPYIDRYILSCSSGKIIVQGAKDIWLQS